MATGTKCKCGNEPKRIWGHGVWYCGDCGRRGTYEEDEWKLDELKRKAELQEIIRAAHREINDYDDAKRFAENRDMAGRCFRARSNYSCPEKPEDYWWLYLRVTEVSADGYLSVWTFAQDTYGNIRIDAPETRPYLTSYEEIEPHVFWNAWDELNGRIRILAEIG